MRPVVLHQVSISPTFYQQLFRTKLFWAAFLYLRLRFVFFWRKDISAKAACKMLVKLTTRCRGTRKCYSSITLTHRFNLGSNFSISYSWIGIPPSSTGAFHFSLQPSAVTLETSNGPWGLEGRPRTTSSTHSSSKPLMFSARTRYLAVSWQRVKLKKIDKESLYICVAFSSIHLSELRQAIISKVRNYFIYIAEVEFFRFK